MATVSSQRPKMKQAPTDIWSTRERLSLASSVMRSGDQNWVSVSRAIRQYGEPNRPHDWFSQKNCALQYSDLLEKSDIPKRKRGERDLETPGEYIVRKLNQERIAELKILIEQDKQRYKKLKSELEEVQCGAADDRLREIWDEILREKKKQEQANEQHQTWLQERAARIAAQAALKPGKMPSMHKRGMSRRASVGIPTSPRLDQSSDIDGNLDSPVGAPLHVDASNCNEESSPHDVGNSVPMANSVSTIATTVVTMPSPTAPSSHSSPLLNTLLRSSSHVCQTSAPTTPKEISPRSQASVTSPTISSLLSSPNHHQSILNPSALSSSVANLLTTALSGPPDHESATPRPPITSPSQGAPTLLKLLDMPLGSPGKLPPLPEVTYRDTPCTTAPPVEPPPVPVVSNVVEICAEEPKPEEYSSEEIVLQQVEENVQTTVEPEQTEALQEVVFKEEVVEEPVVEEIETVDQPKVEIIEEDVPSVIEVEVKEEPNDVVVEVIEVVEGVHDLKDHQECIELVEEEVITESMQHSEFVEEQELQTEEDVGCEEPESQVQEQVPDSGVEIEAPTVIEDIPPPNSVPVEDSKEEAVEVVESPQKKPIDEDLTDVTETQASTDFVPESVEDVDIKQEDLQDVLQDKEEEDVEEGRGGIGEVEEDLEDEEDENNDERPQTPEESHLTLDDSILESEPERNEGFLELEDNSRRLDREIEIPMVSSEKHSPIPPIEEEEKEIEIPLTVPVPMPSSSSIRGSEGGHRGRRRRGGGRGRRGGRMHGSRSSSTFSSCDDSALEEKVEESETDTMEDKDKATEPARESVSTRGRPRLGSPDDGRRKKASRKKKEDLQKEESEKKLEVCKEEDVTIKKEDDSEPASESKATDYPGSEIPGRETDEETKEEVLVGRGITNTDSIPNSPASASASGDDADGGRDYRLWKKAIMLVWRSIANHKYANVFLHAVTEEMAPGYHGVVCRPMDLVSIKKNIENGVIRTTVEFQRDVMLMFQNAIMYNNSDHDVYKMAIEMQKEVIGYIQDFVATQLMVQSASNPKVLRRETREQYQKRDSFGDKSNPCTPQSQEGEKRKRPLSESEGGSTKKRRTRADD